VDTPTLQLERHLLAGGVCCVTALDEVGRGAAAGPVSVGAVQVGAGTGEPPARLRDSKLLSAAARAQLVPQIDRWADRWAVGHASAAEIDQVGIIAALGLAAWRALDQLDQVPLVLLDGNLDWVSAAGAPRPHLPTVVTKVKADLVCASVAAASVVAKVARDEIMIQLDSAVPGYGLARHKGYLTASHTAAIVQLGPSAQHRRSWRLPGASVAPGQ
jgi:ribonuclease HII